MRKKQWYQIEEECDATQAFIIHYFENYSLEETLNYCLQMRHDYHGYFERLIGILKYSATNCPHEIWRAFESVDLTPIHYLDEAGPSMDKLQELFMRMACFLEEHKSGLTNHTCLDNESKKSEDKLMREQVMEFCRTLRAEFDGNLGI